MIHPSDEEALQTIDAAVFTGDPDVIRERLTFFMERWQKVLERRQGRRDRRIYPSVWSPHRTLTEGRRMTYPPRRAT